MRWTSLAGFVLALAVGALLLLSPAPAAAQVCGNGTVEPPEQCDPPGPCCSSGCIIQPINTPCSDNNPCTGPDVCPGNTDICAGPPDSGANGNPCPGLSGDGLFCNGDETCSGGSCVAGTPPCPGPDGDVNCTESCDEDADNCLAADPDGSACNDGLFCNGADSCSGGNCSVNAGDPCPGPDGDGDCTETCDEAADDCEGADPDGSVCTDGDVCTHTDLCSGGACVGTPQTGICDNFKCYVAFPRDPFTPGVSNVALTDQFGTSPDITLRRVSEFCTPVDKNGDGIVDPTAHLTCYAIRDPLRVLKTLESVDQFGTDKHKVLFANRLCVPTIKTEVNGQPVPPGDLGILETALSHYRCYMARGNRNPPNVTTVDQLHTAATNVRKTKLWCNPVEKAVDAEPPVLIVDPDVHLKCYGIKDNPRISFRPFTTLKVENQFGVQTLVLLKESVLCEPALKANPEDILPTP